jgi:hypothetical protein
MQVTDMSESSPGTGSRPNAHVQWQKRDGVLSARLSNVIHIALFLSFTRTLSGDALAIFYFTHNGANHHIRSALELSNPQSLVETTV